MVNNRRDQNRGQTKAHEVIDADGNSTEMTQAEWRNRDKAAGLTRPDDEVVEPVEPLEPVLPPEEETTQE